MPLVTQLFLRFEILEFVVKKNLLVVGFVAVSGLLLMGCASSHSSAANNREVFMRPSLTATPEEIAAMQAQEDKRRQDLDAIAAANARVHPKPIRSRGELDVSFACPPTLVGCSIL